MNRTVLKKLASLRLDDARLLLKYGQHPGAYYLCGYVVECALKACIAKQTKKHDFPDKKIVIASHTHNISELVKIAGLQPVLDSERGGDAVFEVNWNVVKDWSETSRYQIRTEQEARDLYKAVSDNRHGVLRWLKRHW